MDSLRPGTRSRSPAALAAVAVVALAAAIAGGWLWGSHRPSSPPVPTVSSAAPAPVPVPSAPSSAAAAHYPVPESPQATAATDLPGVLRLLFGDAAVASLFETDDIARRFVATVDNLGRSAAPSSVWPVHPARGPFETTRAAGAPEAIAPDNERRYAPYVLMLEHLDLDRFVAAYVQAYPELQRTYRSLGFPHGDFNDRLVVVIDQLLATPEPGGPIGVHLPQLAPGVQTSRPWVLYEFDAAALQSLTAGQRLLVRMGLDNERRVKARLVELRRHLVALGPP